MVLEIATLTIRTGQCSIFEAAFKKAEFIIASMPGYLSHELKRCIERDHEYVLLVRWEKLEDHEIGFRKSSEYKEWKLMLHHFYEPFPIVLHYESLDDVHS
jgi:heme-degrading monooxygenase HmoA